MFYQVIVPKIAICYSNITVIACFLVIFVIIIIKITTIIITTIIIIIKNKNRSYAQNVVFDVQKKRTKLPELGGWGGFRWFGQCPKENVFFLLMSSLTGWETWGHRGDSLKHVYLISSNAFDLSLNDWPPERVFHDTDPIQLLRSNYNLPMDSVMGNSIGGVEIYTSHELGIFLTLYSSTLINNWKTLIYLCTAPPYGQITTSVSLNWASIPTVLIMI